MTGRVTTDFGLQRVPVGPVHGYLDTQQLGYPIQDSGHSYRAEEGPPVSVSDPSLDHPRATAHPAPAGDDILSQATRTIMDQGLSDEYYPGPKRIRSQNSAGK